VVWFENVTSSKILFLLLCSSTVVDVTLTNLHTRHFLLSSASGHDHQMTLVNVSVAFLRWLPNRDLGHNIIDYFFFYFK